MHCSRFVLLWLLCLWVAGTVVAQNAPPAPAPKPDKQAADFLDQAIKALDPQKLGWVETTLWHNVDLEGLVMRGEGRFLTGPDHRLRLNLAGFIGDTKGNLEVICDGTTFWETLQIGDKPREVVNKVGVKKVLTAIEDISGGPKARDEFFEAISFSGSQALLKTLQKKMVFIHKEPLRWQDHDVQVLTGVWPEDTIKKVALSGRWPAYLPRQCRLFLDSQAPHWLRRVEWWGPIPPRASDDLLIQTEFRNPRWGFTLTDEQIAKEFHFEPGTDNVPDQTDRDIQFLRNRARQLAEPEKK